MPPEDFTIESAEKIAAAKEDVFVRDHPELALWMKIRTALSQPDGEQYFASDLKDADVPQLVGKLIEAKPACRPRELLVAIPLPDGTSQSVAELQLKLDKPLTGRLTPGTDLRWQGVPSAFTSQPFLLTMQTEATKIEGLATTPCTGSR
jgi:hypothetical protein